MPSRKPQTAPATPAAPQAPKPSQQNPANDPKPTPPKPPRGRKAPPAPTAPATPPTTAPVPEQSPAVAAGAAHLSGTGAAATQAAPLPPEPRTIKHPKPDARVALGDKALTMEKAKDMLGWRDMPSQEGSMYVPDPNGSYFACVKNFRNRPVYTSHLQKLAQEHLRGRWKFNGVPIIVSNYGSVIDGQHRLLGLIFAEQKRLKQPEAYAHLWKGPITMDTAIIFGIDESDTTINTIDTGKPRSVADTLFRSEYWPNADYNSRKDYARITAFAVDVLWARLRAEQETGAKFRTHAETLDFIARHERLVSECVPTVYNLNRQGDSKVALTEHYLPLGNSAALMYLMGASATLESDYHVQGSGTAASERLINWANWDEAVKFWSYLARRDAGTQPIRNALAKLAENGARVSLSEKTAVIIFAWDQWVHPEMKKEFDYTGLDLSNLLRFRENGDHYLPKGEHPIIGGHGKGQGIDLGDPINDKEVEKEQKEEKPATEANGQVQGGAEHAAGSEETDTDPWQGEGEEGEEGEQWEEGWGESLQEVVEQEGEPLERQEGEPTPEEIEAAKEAEKAAKVSGGRKPR